MNINSTGFEGLFIIEPKMYMDERGYFSETYKRDFLEERLGHDIDFVQENESKSNYGVIRGLHFQLGDKAQAKLVRVIQGEVLDVALDLRKESKTFGKYFSIRLSSDNKRQLFIPRGFAHGFATLKDNTVFSYKIDNHYYPEYEAGINPLDKSLNVDWCIEQDSFIISEKDKSLKEFMEYCI